MQDVTASDLPNADGFMRRSAMRVLAWVQAGLAYLHFGFLDWIALQATPFTAQAEYLDAWAALAPTPVLREAPNFALGPAQWTGAVGVPLPAGTTCTRGDSTMYAVVAGGTADGSGNIAVTVQCVIAGSTGNTDSGTPLTLTASVSQVNPTGAATGAITGGTDLELDPPLRSRMLESYGAPPHGGDQSDYETWALEVAGVTRAWCKPNSVGPGTVTVYIMLDEAEAAFGGFPQGTNGVATLEPRDTPATGDQLAVANWIYPLQPVTALVYGVAPIAQPQNFTIVGLSSITMGQQNAVKAALSGLFVQKGNPLATVGIEQSDCDAAITAVGGLPSFAITSPSSWPITPTAGHLFTLGTVTFA